MRDAFPELDLYLASKTAAAGDDVVRGVTSGLSSDEEYRRTIGALVGRGQDSKRSLASACFSPLRRAHPRRSPSPHCARGSAHGSAHGSACFLRHPTPPLPAQFAVYWMMRIGIDGEIGFSFGVDENWEPVVPEPPSKSDQTATAEYEKRLAFYKSQDWARLQTLVIDAVSAVGIQTLPPRVAARLRSSSERNGSSPQSYP